MKNKTNVHTSSKKEESSQTLLVWILGVIVLQFLVVGGLLLNISNNDSKISDIETKVTRIDSFFAGNAPGYGDGSAPSAVAPSAAAPSAAVDISSVSFDGEPTSGNPDAKVTVIEYSDYECPFCGKFYSESYGLLKEEYIDTGKINFVFKDFPLGFHEKAVPAAAAANCVLRDLGNEKYFEMHDMIFSNQNIISDANFKKWALELGMDSSSYDGCIVDTSIIDEINADLSEGSSLGVSGTPSFFIDGNLIVGAQPYSVIKAEIERALSE
jgi:protein-disulfide isomerase